MKKYILFLTLVSVLMSSDLQMSFDKPYAYTERLQKRKITVPKNRVLPVVNGFEIDRARYKNFYKLRLMYKLSDKTRMNEQREGRYWYLDYKRVNQIKGTKEMRENARKELLEAYRQVLQNKGATIYNRVNSKTSIVFNLDNIWGICQSYPNSFHIEAVEIAAFEQKLKIDPDEIQAELIKKGEIELPGVYFDTAKATLKPASRTAILAAAALLKKYPTLVLEIQGHTDNVGSDESNFDLSDRRAASVREALIDEGIDAKRLESKGYGEKVPVVSNDSDEGRAKNRRVMLKRISGGEEKALISIDFFKPIPGFKKDATKEYQEGELFFRMNQNGKKENKKITGKEVRAYYKMIDTKDRSFSYLEILKNYEGVLKSFGAEIQGKDFPGTQAIFFYLHDRGDGQKIYGKVSAYNSGDYTIHFFIPYTQK